MNIVLKEKQKWQSSVDTTVHLPLWQMDKELENYDNILVVCFILLAVY